MTTFDVFDVTLNEVQFEVGFSDFQQIEVVTGEVYTGSYEVTPKVTEQIMETAEKYMLEDVTIHAVPIYKTSNESGGSTVYIAREIDADG